jgi:predicted phosphodiesterase
VKLGVVADIHGNDEALRAVLADADRFGVDRWWALGDLVLFGPRPEQVLELLRGLPGIEMLRGNTDRDATGLPTAPRRSAGPATAAANCYGLRAITISSGEAVAEAVRSQSP